MWISLYGPRCEAAGAGRAGWRLSQSNPSLECSSVSTARSSLLLDWCVQPALPHSHGMEWLGKQGERHPPDANPHETGLKWVLTSVCANKNEILLNSCFVTDFTTQFLFASWSYLTESPERSQNRMGESLNNHTEFMRQIWGELCKTSWWWAHHERGKAKRLILVPRCCCEPKDWF